MSIFTAVRPCHLVVQLAGQETALVLLGIDEPGRQPLEVFAVALLVPALTLHLPLQQVGMARRHRRDGQRADERAEAHRQQTRADLVEEELGLLLVPGVRDRLHLGELIENREHRLPARQDAVAKQRRRGGLRRRRLLAEGRLARHPEIAQLGLQPLPLDALLGRLDLG